MSRSRRPPPTMLILFLLPMAMVMAFIGGFCAGYFWPSEIALALPATPTLPNTPTAIPSPTATGTAAPTPTATDPPTPTLPPPTETPTPRAGGWLSQLSLEDKIGQMIMAGLPSGSLDSSARAMITTTRAGGIWFTRRNITNAQQAQALIADLQALAVETGAGIPLFISVDHEGGDINRFGADLTMFPSNMAVGAAGCDQWAWAVGQAEGAELIGVGFNMNLAPVLDINNNPYNPVIHIRSYSAYPDRVAACGQQYIAGLTSTGIIPVAKHFPGHGNTTVDSHAGLPVIAGSPEELNVTEFYPFAQAINAGLPGIMIGHLLVPSLDPNLPASLSPTIVTEALRNQMGFNGVVFTDDIARMSAINASYTIGQAAIKAVQAGSDVLVMNAYQETAQAVKDSLMWAVRNGAISESRIDESVQRILLLKDAHGLMAGQTPTPAPAPDYAANANLADRVALDAITWRPINGVGLLPLSGNVLLVAPEDRLEIVSPDGDVRTNLGMMLQERGAVITEYTYDSTAAEQRAGLMTDILNQTANNNAAVVLTWDAALALRASYQWQRDLIAGLTAQTPNVIVVALHTPYDLRVSPDIGGYLMTYGNTPSQIRGLADVLSGWQSALGAAPFPDDALGLNR